MRISARMEELRRGREGAQVAESGLQRDPSMHRTRAVRWPFATEQIIFFDMRRFFPLAAANER
jgi:hypothetical protein